MPILGEIFKKIRERLAEKAKSSKKNRGILETNETPSKRRSQAAPIRNGGLMIALESIKKEWHFRGGSIKK